MAAPKRSEGLDVLLALARELSAISTIAGLRDALDGSLRPLLPSRDVSILRASHGAWQPVAGPDDAPERISRYSWTPLTGDGRTVGMLGFGAPAAGAPGGKMAEGATALLAIAVQHLLALDNLRHDSVRDGLTGCFNRDYAMEVLDANLRRASRTGFPVSIVLIDVDDFKRINDRYGHVPGDAVLAAVGKELHGMLRQSDVRCRLGGDEFLVILPDTGLDDALRVGEAMRHAIEEVVVPSVRGRVRITASIGVAAATPGETMNVSSFIDRADVALYRAKQAGRNAVQGSAPPGARTQPSHLRLAATRPA